MVVAHLGWADLDLGCSDLLSPVGQQVAAVTAHQPEELPKSQSTKPRCATTIGHPVVIMLLKGLGRVRGVHERAEQRGAAGEHPGEAGAGPRL